MPAEVVERQREAMRRRRLSALAVMSPENVCWTSGAMIPSQQVVRHRHAIVLVPAEGDLELIVVNIEEGFARAHTDIPHVFAYNEFTEHPMALLAERIRARGIRGRLGVEARYLSYHDFLLLQAALNDAVDLEPVDDELERLRMRKTPGEIDRLVRAGRIAEQVAYEALRAWRDGLTEADLAGAIIDRFRAAGGERLTMLSVTAGERSPMLNGVPTSRLIRRGDVVRIDVIGTVEGYYCDVARTAVAGAPTPEVETYWTRLVACRDRALDMIRPGMSTQAIYRAYIERMDAWGMPTLHFLGHGLGLSLHEEPYINRYKDTTLEEGMVLAIEPLVVFRDLGLQLEETVVVRAQGAELITGQHDVRRIWRMEELPG